MKGKLFIGTSNVVVPGPKHTFPREFQSSPRLSYYSALFNSVEINSTFYKLPQSKTLARWVDETVSDFSFTVKLPRTITHQKLLHHDPGDIDTFLRLIDSMHEKQGCLLVQFPASITEDYFERVLGILKRIRRSNRNGWNVFVEFRHDSWYAQHVYKMLRKQKAAWVIHDKRGSKTPMANVPLNIVYWRFHGPHGDYRGTYSREALIEYGNQIKRWRAQGKTVYAYFNNTIGTAFEDARALQSLCNE
jgi:uncharacterized protein YecE (DUF72 family)